MTEEEKAKIEKLKTRNEELRKGVFYSIQRIDLLIISVSGAGIYACLEILKFLYEHNKICKEIPFKITGLVFIIAIISNFISQWTAFTANNIDSKRTLKEIDVLEQGVDLQKEIIRFKTLSNRYDKFTHITNIISTFAMLCGLIIISISIYLNL